MRDSGTPSSSASVVRTVVVEASGTDCGDLGGLCFLPGAEATVNTPPSLILIGEEFVEVKQVVLPQL